MTKSEELKARLREQTVVSQPTTEPTMSKSQMLKQQLVQQMQPQQVQQPVQQVTTQPVATQPTNTQYGAGNIDLTKRPVVQNDDGSISTVRSMSFNEDGKEILVPTVVNGRVVSDQEAIDHYHKTGEYLGKFNTIDEANAYAENLHNQQEKLYGHSVKAQQGMQQAQDKLHVAEKPMTAKLQSGQALTPAEVYQLAAEQGRISKEEAAKQIAIENQPMLQRDLARTQEEINKDVKDNNILGDVNSKKYFEYQEKRDEAKEKGDIVKETKYQNLLDKMDETYKPMTKDWYNIQKPDTEFLQGQINNRIYDVKWAENKLLEAKTPEEQQEKANEYIKQYEKYQDAVKKYQDALLYEKYNNNPILDELNILKYTGADSLSNFIEGTAEDLKDNRENAIGVGYDFINADKLLEANNKRKNMNKGSILYAMPTNTALNALRYQAEKEDAGEDIKNLYTQILNGTYNGTAEDINKILTNEKREKNTFKRKEEIQQSLQHKKEKFNWSYEPSPMAKKVLDSLETVTRMIPNQAASMLAPGLGDIVMYETAGNQAQDKAYAEGANYKGAGLNKALKGSAEAAFEHLTESTIDTAVGRTGLVKPSTWAERISNPLLRTGADLSYNIVMEGVEEIPTTVLDPLIDRITHNPDAPLATVEDIWGAFRDSLLPSAIMIGTGGALQAIDNYANNSRNKINNSNLTDLQKAELLNEIENGRKELIKQIEQRKAEIDAQATNVTQQQTVPQAIENYRSANPTQPLPQDLARANAAMTTPVQDVANSFTNNQIARDAEALNLQPQQTSAETMQRNVENSAQNKTIAEKVAELNKRGFNIPQSTANTLQAIQDVRGTRIEFDDTIDGNGVYDAKNRIVYLNPNSTRAIEFTIAHELGHDIKAGNLEDYNKLQKAVLDYAGKQKGYTEGMQALDNTYRSFQEKQRANGQKFEYDINDEMTNDILGEVLGNQEFLNSLAQEQPNLFQKVWNWIKNVLIDNTNGRLSFEERRMLNKYEQGFRNAYQKSFNGTQQQGTQQSLSGKPKQITDNMGKKLTPEQSEYFKDSFVKNLYGELLRVYHGTRADSKFTVFNPNTGTNIDAVYFTDTPSVASHWGGTGRRITQEQYDSLTSKLEKANTVRQVLNVINNANIGTKHTITAGYKDKNLGTYFREETIYEGDDYPTSSGPLGYSKDRINFYDEKGNPIDALEKMKEIAQRELDYAYFKNGTYYSYLNITNPLFVNANGRPYWQIDFEGKKVNTETIASIAKERGYDGVIIRDVLETDYENQLTNDYIVFSPEQIKDIDNSKPTNNPDIRYQKQNQSWQQFLDNTYGKWNTGTRTNFEGLPSNEELQRAETKSVENEPIARYSLSEEEQKEVNEYINQLNNDTTLDDKYKDQILTKFDNLTNYKQFEDIKQEVQDYKDKAYKGIKSLVDVANMSEDNVRQRPMEYTQRKDKNTPNQRRFFDNVETSNIVADETKNRINPTTYEVKHNLDTLEKMRQKLDERGNDLVEDWKHKSKNFNDNDVALGAILLERYQQQGDWDSAARTAEKLADMSTETARALQMYSIWQRLSPETMQIFAQKQLNEAFEEMKKRQTGKWVEANKDKFKLTAEETQFIYDQVEKASQAIDDETKQRELSKIERMINDKLPPEKGQTIKALRRIAMLFNPKTQVRNFAGNSIIAPINDVADLVGTALDRAIAKKTGVRTTSLPNLATKAKGFGKGFKQAVKDYKTGTRTTASGNKYEFDIGAKPFNENTSSKVRNKIARGLNATNELLSAVMSGGDRPFYEAAYQNSLEGQMKANKVSEPTQEMIDIAVNEALQRTWNDSNKYTETVLKIRKAMNTVNIRGFGLGDLIIPFAKTPANLTKAMVEYSPAGFIESVIDFNDMRKAISRGEMTPMQQKKFVSSTSKAIAGSLLYLIAGSLVKAGTITGSADDDKDVKNFEQNVLGIQPYSVKIGDKTYTYSWANPINAPLAIMADTYKMSKENASKWDILNNAFKVAGETLVDNSFLQGIKELFSKDSISEGIVDAIESFPESLIPTFLSQIASLGDDKQRQTFEYQNDLGTISNKIKNKTPGLRNTLAPQVNTFGEEIENQNNAINAFLNPANVREARITESQKALYDVYQDTKDKAIFPMQAPYYVSIDGEKKNLTSQDRVTYQKASGQYVSQIYDDLFTQDAFNQSYHVGNDGKVEILKQIASDGNTKGKEAVGATTTTTERLNEKIDMLEDAGIPLADYYLTWYAQKNVSKKNAKRTAISQTIDHINEGDHQLDKNQKNVLYEIFNVK